LAIGGLLSVVATNSGANILSKREVTSICEGVGSERQLGASVGVRVSGGGNWYVLSLDDSVLDNSL